MITRSPSCIALNILSIEGVRCSPESGSFTKVGSSTASEVKLVSSDPNIAVLVKAEILPEYSSLPRELEPRLEENAVDPSRRRVAVPKRVERESLEKTEGM